MEKWVNIGGTGDAERKISDHAEMCITDSGLPVNTRFAIEQETDVDFVYMFIITTRTNLTVVST